MGLPLIEDRARVIMDRSIQNLEIIKCVRIAREADGNDVESQGPHDVTQLLNSFLGALIQPWEEIRKDGSVGSAMKEPISRLVSRNLNWPFPAKEWPGDRDPKNYAQLLTWMRNAFAHSNLELQGSGSSIETIRIWNECNCGNRSWGTRLSIDELEDFLYFFQDMAYGRLNLRDPWARKRN